MTNDQTFAKIHKFYRFLYHQTVKNGWWDQWDAVVKKINFDLFKKNRLFSMRKHFGSLETKKELDWQEKNDDHAYFLQMRGVRFCKNNQHGKSKKGHAVFNVFQLFDCPNLQIFATKITGHDLKPVLNNESPLDLNGPTTRPSMTFCVTGTGSIYWGSKPCTPSCLFITIVHFFKVSWGTSSNSPTWAEKMLAIFFWHSLHKEVASGGWWHQTSLPDGFHRASAPGNQPPALFGAVETCQNGSSLWRNMKTLLFKKKRKQITETVFALVWSVEP